MLTQHGPMCALCGRYILVDPAMEWFTVEGCKTMLCCHTDCKPLIIDAGKDWTKLPTGPLREMFQRAEGKK